MVIVIYNNVFTVLANNSSDVSTDFLQEPHGNVNNTFCQHIFALANTDEKTLPKDVIIGCRHLVGMHLNVLMKRLA